ncbi:hypothetical protein J3E74DRAFT_438327 [Bipolaris maydis]|nr:hypothetical protein J3E74DRAFT_438327 [Bipolaris maydis]
MDDNVEIPEESMRHIEALLARHPPHLIQRMFSQALESRRNSTASSFMSTSTVSSSATTSSGSSWRSRLSMTSTFSSSSSSSNRRSPMASSSSSLGLDPTRPVPAALSSDTDSPLDLKIEPSSTPTDTLSSQSQTGESYMFCTYCAEQKNQKTFKAKSDWKKHEMRMHETGEDWPCIDFIKHHQRYHTGRPLPSLTDIGITLLPRRVFGCGFDKCKEVSIGWDERCDHVAKHMKNGATIDQWKYSNVIRNLIRQEALYDTWKELISCLDERLRESRSQISWCPDNTRILRQKLQCCDLRPSREEVLITALSLRSDMQLDPVDQQLPPGFVTPSRDSVPNVEKLSREQRMHVLIGNSDPHVARARLATVNAALVRAINSLSHMPSYDCASSPFMEPQSPARDNTNHRISYMDVDPGDYLDVAQPAIPDLPPAMTTAAMHTPNTHTPIMDQTQQAQMYPNEYIDQAKTAPNPLEALYPNYFGGAPQFEESQYYDRPSFGQLITKPLHKIGNRLGASRSSSTHSRPSSSMSQTMPDLNADYPVAVMGMRHTPEPQQQQQQQQQQQPSLHQMQHLQHQQHLMHHQQQSFRHLTPQMHDQLHMYATQN